MIYSKLDWFTCMAYGVSFKDVFTALEINEGYWQDFLTDPYQRNMGYVTKQVYSVNGVNVEFTADENEHLISCENIFEEKINEIRLDITGKGLDWLRTFCDIDNKLRDPDMLNIIKPVKIKRADFAFDFVNVHGDFLDTFINYLKEKERQADYNSYSNRLTISHGRYIQYKYVIGYGEKILYLGSTRSERLIRIYDKLLQYQTNGIITKELPCFSDDDTVSSWWRWELQARHNTAHEMLYGSSSNNLEVLKDITKTYRLSKDGERLSFIDNLMDWEHIYELREMKILEQVQTVKAVNETKVDRVLQDLLLYIIIHGWKSFINRINNRMLSMDNDSYKAVVRKLTLNRKVALYLAQEGLSIEDLYDITYDADRHDFMVNPYV